MGSGAGETESGGEVLSSGDHRDDAGLCGAVGVDGAADFQRFLGSLLALEQKPFTPNHLKVIAQ